MRYVVCSLIPCGTINVGNFFSLTLRLWHAFCLRCCVGTCSNIAHGLKFVLDAFASFFFFFLLDRYFCWVRFMWSRVCDVWNNVWLCVYAECSLMYIKIPCVEHNIYLLRGLAQQIVEGKKINLEMTPPSKLWFHSLLLLFPLLGFCMGGEQRLSLYVYLTDLFRFIHFQVGFFYSFVKLSQTISLCFSLCHFEIRCPGTRHTFAFLFAFILSELLFSDIFVCYVMINYVFCSLGFWNWCTHTQSPLKKYLLQRKHRGAMFSTAPKSL